MSPSTAQLGLLQYNPESNASNGDNESDADDGDKDDSTVATSNTAILLMDKIERSRTTHRSEIGDEIGDAGTSDIDGDGFDVIQGFEMPTNDNANVKVLNEYDEQETCVYDGIGNASLLGSTRDYLPGAPAGWYLQGSPEGWRPWARKPKTRKPKFPSVDNPDNWSKFTFQSGFTGNNRTGKYIAHITISGAILLPNMLGLFKIRFPATLV